MDNENKKDMTNEEAEQKFKDAVFNAFSEKNPDVYRDEDGFIVFPRVRIKKKSSEKDWIIAIPAAILMDCGDFF